MSFIQFGSRIFNADHVVSVGVVERKTRNSTYYSVSIKTTSVHHPYYDSREYDTRKEAEDRMEKFVCREEEEEEVEEDVEEEVEATGVRFDRNSPKEKEEASSEDVEVNEFLEEELEDLEEDNSTADTKLFYICPSKKCKSILPLSLDAFSTETEYFCHCGKQIELPSNIIACSGFD
jgi:hypothetical protein